MTRVIKQLHSRDTRLHYCPADHWLSSKIELQVDLVRISEAFQRFSKDLLITVSRFDNLTRFAVLLNRASFFEQRLS